MEYAADYCAWLLRRNISRRRPAVSACQQHTANHLLRRLVYFSHLGIACTTVFFFLLRKKITLKERMVLQETYNAQRPGGIVRMVKNVIIGTLAVEGCGAALYMFQFVPEYGLAKGVWYSVYSGVRNNSGNLVQCVSCGLRILQCRN